MKDFYEQQKFKLWFLAWLLIIFSLANSTVDTFDFEFSDFFVNGLIAVFSPFIWFVTIAPFVVVLPDLVYRLGKDNGCDMAFIELYKGEHKKSIERSKNRGEKEFLVMGSDLAMVYLPIHIKIDSLMDAFPNHFKKQWYLHEKGNIEQKQKLLVLLSFYCLSLALCIFFTSEGIFLLLIPPSFTYITYRFYDFGFNRGYHDGLLVLRKFGYREDKQYMP